MKITKYILIIISLFVIAQTSAQSRKVKNIKTGFVFVDGGYIDTPYKIERKGLDIYINGNLAQSYEDKFEGSNKNPFHYKIKPEVPDGLNENSDLDDFYNAKDNVKGIPILNTTGYFYLNYPYEVAIDSIVAFIEGFPNIDHVKKQGVNKHKIILKNGQETSIFIGVTAEKNAKRWGPDGPGKMSKRKYAKTINRSVQKIEEELSNDYLLIFTPDSDFQKISVNQTEKLILVDSIMHDSSLDDENKTDSLIEIINITRHHKPFENFVKNYKTSKQFKKRIDEMDVYIDKSNRKKSKIQIKKPKG